MIIGLDFDSNHCLHSSGWQRCCSPGRNLWRNHHTGSVRLTLDRCWYQPFHHHNFPFMNISLLCFFLCTFYTSPQVWMDCLSVVRSIKRTVLSSQSGAVCSKLVTSIHQSWLSQKMRMFLHVTLVSASRSGLQIIKPKCLSTHHCDLMHIQCLIIYFSLNSMASCRS